MNELAGGIYMWVIVGGHLLGGSLQFGDLPIGQLTTLEICQKNGRAAVEHNKKELTKQFPDLYRPGIVLCIDERGTVIDKFEWK